MFRYVLDHPLGAGVPVSPERACEITGPFCPVAPPGVKVADVKV
jgi:hypothetical protein